MHQHYNAKGYGDYPTIEEVERLFDKVINTDMEYDLQKIIIDLYNL